MNPGDLELVGSADIVKAIEDLQETVSHELTQIFDRFGDLEAYLGQIIDQLKALNENR